MDSHHTYEFLSRYMIIDMHRELLTMKSTVCLCCLEFGYAAHSTHRTQRVRMGEEHTHTHTRHTRTVSQIKIRIQVCYYWIMIIIIIKCVLWLFLCESVL